MSLLERARQLDANDPLAERRALFSLDPGRIYLDGNSLGPPSIATAEGVNRLLEHEWRRDLIAGWNDHDWLSLPVKVGDAISPLLGAAPGQVVCCDNLTSNLYKLVCAALAARSDRSVILTETDNFPTDNYVLQGIQQTLGESRLSIRAVPADTLLQADFSDVALVSLSHVSYKNGRMHDLTAVTQRAQAAGAWVLWDLAHSAGAVDLALDDAGVDMAVGCTYKFLNGGPGAPGFLYLAERHQASLQPPIAGWMGHARLFAFEDHYAPAAGIQRWLTGTPSVLALASVQAALQAFESVTPQQLRTKSLSLTHLFFDALAQYPLASTLECLTPYEPQQRGSQICLRHPHGYGLAQALIDSGVVVDFRAPDIVRFGFAPLYNQHQEVCAAASILEQCLSEQRFLNPDYTNRKAVT